MDAPVKAQPRLKPPMDTLSHQQYFFGGFTLDLTIGCLLQGENEVKLRPKSFAVLKYLVENNGRLISKDQLIQAVWVDISVTDDSLVKCLKDIRHALRDETQQMIKTVPRRGYIFAAKVSEKVAVAPVMTIAEETSGVQVIIEEETSGDRRLAALPTAKSIALLPEQRAAGLPRLTSAIKGHHWIVAAGGLLTLAIVAAATVYLIRPRETIDSIAVLPFVNGSNSAEAEYLSDGISDSLISSLSQSPNLKRVVPFTSVLRYKGKQIDPQSVGRELNVPAVVTGRLVQRGDEFLVSVELIDTKENKRLWGQQYELKSKATLNLQRQISREISENLRLRLTAEPTERLAKHQTESAEAYELYLQGRYYWRRFTDETLIKSSDCFQRAIEKDPKYALAYAGLADSFIARAFAGQMQSKEAWPKAEDAAVKALAIDDTIGEAHYSLAQVKLYKYWDWAGAERECRRAIALDPEFTESHARYARLLDALGRFDEAVAEAKRAQEIDPLSTYYRAQVGQILYHARRYDEAIEEYRKEPDSVQTYIGLGEIYVAEGRYEEALAAMLKARPLVRRTRQLARIGTVYAAAGKKDEAVKILEEVKSQTAERYDLGTHIAAIYALLGNKDEAFAWLDNAYEARTYALIEVKVNPMFRNLHSDSRFRDLLGRIGLPF